MSWNEAEWLARARAEIEALHRFIEGWLGGTLPRAADAFAPFGRAMAPSFVIVGPGGVATDRAALLAGFEAAHGAQANISPPFAVRIEDVRLRQALGDRAMLTYEEWQEHAGGLTGRLSSVLLGRADDAPRGLAWLHLHETWLPGKSGS